MHDQQHAQEARGDGQPARQAGALAQEQHAERDHDQRRGGGNGMGVGQRQVLKASTKMALSITASTERAACSQGRRVRNDARRPLAPHDEPGEQAEHAVADPHHLADRVVGDQPFAHRVHAGEAQHGKDGIERAEREVAALGRSHSAAATCRAGGRNAGITRSANSFRLRIAFSRP